MKMTEIERLLDALRYIASNSTDPWARSYARAVIKDIEELIHNNETKGE